MHSIGEVEQVIGQSISATLIKDNPNAQSRKKQETEVKSNKDIERETELIKM